MSSMKLIQAVSDHPDLGRWWICEYPYRTTVFRRTGELLWSR